MSIHKSETMDTFFLSTTSDLSNSDPKLNSYFSIGRKCTIGKQKLYIYFEEECLYKPFNMTNMLHNIIL